MKNFIKLFLIFGLLVSPTVFAAGDDQPGQQGVQPNSETNSSQNSESDKGDEKTDNSLWPQIVNLAGTTAAGIASVAHVIPTKVYVISAAGVATVLAARRAHRWFYSDSDRKRLEKQLKKQQQQVTQKEEVKSNLLFGLETGLTLGKLEERTATTTERLNRLELDWRQNHTVLNSHVLTNTEHIQALMIRVRTLEEKSQNHEQRLLILEKVPSSAQQ